MPAHKARHQALLMMSSDYSDNRSFNDPDEQLEVSDIVSPGSELAYRTKTENVQALKTLNSEEMDLKQSIPDNGTIPSEPRINDDDRAKSADNSTILSVDSTDKESSSKP